MWPFGSPGMQHQLSLSPQQSSPDHRLNSLNLQSSPLRCAWCTSSHAIPTMLTQQIWVYLAEQRGHKACIGSVTDLLASDLDHSGELGSHKSQLSLLAETEILRFMDTCRGMPALQGAMHGGEPDRLHASQPVFQDKGKSAIPPQLQEAVLADSLYRSVTERLQSGAGPASFNQVWLTSFLCSAYSLQCYSLSSYQQPPRLEPSQMNSCWKEPRQKKLPSGVRQCSSDASALTTTLEPGCAASQSLLCTGRLELWSG